jgi:integrase
MARARQYADRVNIIKMVKVGGKWRFARIVERNGRIIRDHVWVDGREEHHPEGRYYLEWYENGKRRRRPVESYDLLLPAARAKSIEVNAMKAGLITPPEAPVASPPTRLTMDAAINQYLEYIRKHRSLRTYRTYRPALNVLFRNSYSKTYVDEVTREDILKFTSDCFDQGLVPRTVYDRLVTVLQLFKRHGYKGLVEASDWPSYVETIRPIYEPEEITAILQHASVDEAILIKFSLTSGFRDREIRYVTWRDVDLRNSVARVTAKPIWKFKPKNHEERAVPLPAAMIEQLQQLRARRNATPAELIFPNSKGKPNSLHIEVVKEVAHRAKLNCGQCVTKHGNRCSQGPYCQRFYLHKFRHTFATEHLRHGIDVRTLQGWMGHRDIQSTMVYLKGIQSKDALVKVNGGSLAAYIS